jgi:hypothetical protein
MDAERIVRWLAVTLGACSLFILHTFVYAQTGYSASDATGALSLSQYPSQAASGPIVVNHACTDLTKIPQNWIQTAKSNLHIAYGHTSHGSQLTDGMTGLVGFINNGGLGLSYPENFFAWNNGGAGGALDLHDQAMVGDAGYYPDWVNNTRGYLGEPNPATGRGTVHPNTNVIIWSWCTQVSVLTEEQMTSNYLAPMSVLETQYWGVKFVYMTGHLDGGGAAGNLNVRNDQIRAYCQTNNKTLYDFADIESYDPDGLVHYMPLMCNDNCEYVSGGTSHNWALEWQSSHTEGVDWYDCSSAHSQPLNANRKAYAAWWLWARLAGWNGISATGRKPLPFLPLLLLDH